MPYSSGAFSRIYNWVTDKNNSVNITASRMDAEDDGFATGLSTCVLKDGTQTITANLPMAGFKFTGLGAGTAATDSARISDVQNSTPTWCGIAGGTANVLTLTPTPAVTAYAAGQRFTFRTSTPNPNSVAATINVSGLGAKSVYKYLGGAAVATVVDDLPSANICDILYDSTLGGFILLNAPTHSHGADVASVAGTTVLDTVTGDIIDITGTNAITAITLAEGRCVRVRAAGAFTLTNGASLVCPTSANIVCAAGDQFDVVGYASGVVRIYNYQRLNGVPLSMAQITNSLGSDVACNNTANYFDGPSVAQGTSGTWLATGTVTVRDTAGAATFMAKLWDGTTVIASGGATTNAINNLQEISLSGYLASPAGNIRISVRDTTSTSGVILFNNTGNSKDSTISAVRIT